MKYIKKIVWIVLILHVAILVYALVGFQVDDMTLSRGEVYKFNEGWTLTREDGSSIAIGKLPYLGTSEPQETVVMENVLPEEYWGMTMSFLSADKVLRVRIDGETVYEFGVSDQRSFGHTPGSVVNFIDIPLELDKGDICIEMVSPYSDYAARINEITIGKRDVLILKLLADNSFRIACSFFIIICGIGFALLFFIRKATKQDTEGVQYICGFCIVSAVYYFIETKTASIFYGNQTIYSIMIFLCLMIMPFWLLLYYGNGILGCYKKRWTVMLGLLCANIFFQLLFQLLNVFDFMEMAFISHALLTLSMLIIGKSYFDIHRERDIKNLRGEMAAWFLMAAGGMIDILRMYAVGVGDMGKYSRLGATAFSMIMLYKHFRQMIMGYTYNIEENARLMKHEMEYVEKKNAQLERANELAEEAKQEALAANAAKGRFLAQMSHEIRTPINAVLGMNTMILRETKDAQIKEYALDIQNAGQNLLALINDILDFSKIESGKLEIIPVEYDLSSMIHDISNMIVLKIRKKRLEFCVHVDEQLPCKLLGDDVRIRQVLVNLLNNAVKYTNEGRVSLTVSSGNREGKALVDFSVEDTGIGIRQEDISKLFKEFERLEEKRNRNVEGTGLGLNITIRLLELMGSSLNVESEYGKGSRFYFTLEQQIVDSKPIGNLEERLRQQTVEYSYTEAFTAPNANVLVVDDNTINLKVFVNLLKTTKMRVDTVDSGREALEMVRKKHYHLIFLDHMMPDLDGIETLHRMKALQDSKCQNTPVVALTANAITGAKEMYLAEGFHEFLSKPIDPEKLEQMILSLLPREMLMFHAGEENDGDVQTRSEVKEEIQNTSGETDDNPLPMVDGVDWNYGLLHLPERDMLLDTVADFYKTIDSEADCLEEFYHGIKAGDSQKMLERYRIKVHAMKSTANLIGATVLGGMAKILENAAKDADMDVLDSLTSIFLKEWRSYKDKLKKCVKNTDEKIEINDDTVVLEKLEMLRDAMLEMDIDGMDQSMGELERFLYPDDIQEEIDRLSVFVTELDGEQAVPLLERLMKQIKEQEDGRNAEWEKEF